MSFCSPPTFSELATAMLLKIPAMATQWYLSAAIVFLSASINQW